MVRSFLLVWFALALEAALYWIGRFVLIPLETLAEESTKAIKRARGRCHIQRGQLNRFVNHERNKKVGG